MDATLFPSSNQAIPLNGALCGAITRSYFDPAGGLTLAIAGIAPVIPVKNPIISSVQAHFKIGFMRFSWKSNIINCIISRSSGCGKKRSADSYQMRVTDKSELAADK
jgi:hypothetical protein